MPLVRLILTDSSRGLRNLSQRFDKSSTSASSFENEYCSSFGVSLPISNYSSPAVHSVASLLATDLRQALCRKYQAWHCLFRHFHGVCLNRALPTRSSLATFEARVMYFLKPRVCIHVLSSFLAKTTQKILVVMREVTVVGVAFVISVVVVVSGGGYGCSFGCFHIFVPL